MTQAELIGDTMARKKMTGRTFSTGLSGIAALAASACLVFALPQLTTAAPVSKNNAATFSQNFSTWIPRKGKMTYEEDATQDDYGQGRRRVRKVTCAQLPGYVGLGGGAEDEDIVVVTTKGVCNINGLQITKAVTIRPAETVPPLGRDLASMRLSTIADKYANKFDCSTMTSACITINVAIGKTVVIENFHIFTNKPMMAPLVESRSGGLALRNNMIVGAVERDYDNMIHRYEQPAVIIVHGSHVSLQDNLIARASVGVMLMPTQFTPKSHFTLSGNVLTQIEVGVHASGSTFMTSEGPMTKVNLINNYITPALRDDFRSATYGPWAQDNSAANDADDAQALPDDDKVLGLDTSPVGYSVFVTGVNLKMRGNSLGSAENHVQLQNSRAFFEQNIFRGADRYSIYPLGNNQISINRNLFDDNDQIIYQIGYALENHSPMPAGNVCLNQNFRSFYRGPFHMTGYIKNVDTSPQYVLIANPEDKISRSALRKSKRASPEMWADYEGVSSLAKADEKKNASTNTNVFVMAANGTLPTKKKAKKPRDMWNVFRTFYEKQTEPVVAHVLFDRSDVADNTDYRACFDYSTLYKFANPVESEDSPFITEEDL